MLCDENGILQPLEFMIVNTQSDIFTSELKNIECNKVSYIALNDNKLIKKLKKLILKISKILKFRHFARFDFRYQPITRKLYFLEANLCPSFAEDDDFFNCAKISGLSFKNIIENITKAALTDDVHYTIPFNLSNKINKYEK